LKKILEPQKRKGERFWCGLDVLRVAGADPINPRKRKPEKKKTPRPERSGFVRVIFVSMGFVRAWF
jgi:hypothetical protein